MKRTLAVIDLGGVLANSVWPLAMRVWNSTAEIRYLVLPERPAGTDRLSEAALVLVTRDAMIGVAKVTASKGRTA